MKPALRALLVLFISICALAQKPADPKPVERGKPPLVYIRGNGSVTVSASGVAIGPFAGASASTSRHDETMELAEHLFHKCPEISITVERSDPVPDYELFLNRESLGWFNSGFSQIMLLRPSDKTVVYATKKGKVSKAVHEACKAILTDWKEHGRQQGAVHSAPAAPAQTGSDWWQTAKEKKP